MVDLKLLHKLLGMSKKERDELLKDDAVYQKHSHLFENKGDKQKRLINRTLDEKIKNTGAEANLRAYLGMKNDVKSMMAIADKYLGRFNKQKYMEAIQSAINEDDPAESSKRLGEIFEAIRQEVAFAAGEEITGAAADDKSFEDKAKTYIGAAMKYLQELKEK